MTEQGRQGEDWDAGELDAIVADHFAMLGDELAQRPYVKAHHRAGLLQRIGRSAGSIERKHQNISAVLMELGLPWIWGYKPLTNYQETLFEAVDRYLTIRRVKKGRVVATVTQYEWFEPDGHEYTGYADPVTSHPRPVPEVLAEYKKAMAVVALDTDDSWDAAWGKLL
ncbi:MAG: hypothetical protein E5Y06_12375 [Mesorhizobium sp.]|uniref:hypothetical protein n=1 Tax=Mesorhizobium sp. TaxID=1871066 RepID=UPI0012038F63|nr:hypothetical protein [Mesorhizobium sp.]TIN95540.1 MAG: hypothetical protein E5Y06_12375 [Mesorhizobium sp.]TJU97187.1 MAG: hypothetical protein E5Y08_18965 [Mesorhizobium sp.]